MQNSRISNPQAGQTNNLLLDALPELSADRLFRHLRKMTCALGDSICEPDVPIPNVVFPTDGIVSIVTMMMDGTSVEVGLIGREGMVGNWLALGSRSTAQHALVQVAGSALEMDAAAFEEALAVDRDLRTLILQFAHVTLSAASQFAACNRLHPVSERCARWLLMAHDRAFGDEIALTQEYLSQMLGVRRSGVSVAAAGLERAGFISYRRGRINIIDRTGLESASCECYDAVNDQYRSLMKFEIRKR